MYENYLSLGEYSIVFLITGYRRANIRTMQRVAAMMSSVLRASYSLSTFARRCMESERDRRAVTDRNRPSTSSSRSRSEIWTDNAYCRQIMCTQGR
jgi:hypothetical protein